jgi:DNA modification methylase
MRVVQHHENENGMSEKYMLLESDALEAMKLLPSDSVDAVLSDPPYALGTREPSGEEIIAYLNGAELNTGGDFMNKKWSMPSVAVWREMYRVMRPGAHALIFGGTRMFDVLTIGLRMAGFECRDVLSWQYFSGMPKSRHIGKDIDKKLGATRPVIGTRVLTGNAAIPTKDKGGTYGVQVGTAPPKTINVTGPATEAAARFEGHGTGLKPCWEPVVLVRKPIDRTIAETAMKHGTGGINLDGCRIEFASDADEQEAKIKNQHADFGSAPRENRIYGADHRPMDNYDADGRWPPNLLYSHLDECRPGDNCPPWCPVAMLDAQSGERPGMNGGGQHSASYGGGMFGAIDSTATSRNDIGGASRFIATFHGDEVERFKYCSKTSKAEREFGCEHLPARSGAQAVDRGEGSAGVNNPRAGASRTSEKVHNIHPTLKPIALARWLATLLLPPVLDRPRRILIPYSGAGSEMIGAIRAGWDEVVGIQRTSSEDEAHYVVIARARIARWTEVPATMSEMEAVGEARTEKKKIDPKQTSMF